MVTVKFGVNQLSLAVEGQDIASVRRTYQGPLGMVGDEVAVLNGERLEDDGDADALRSGDVLEFTKAAGEKGC